MVECEDVEALIHQLFDEDESEVSLDVNAITCFRTNYNPESNIQPCTACPGLFQVKGFLDATSQELLWQILHQKEFLGDAAANQSMRFGDLPAWTNELSLLIEQTAREFSLLSEEVIGRHPLFDQIIMNLYRPGEGIASHVDLARFQDGICSVSLGSAAVMTFTHVTDVDCKHEVLLEPGDLLLFSGEARYQWKHGIAAVMHEMFAGRQLQRGMRMSVTFRRLCPGIVLTEQ